MARRSRIEPNINDIIDLFEGEDGEAKSAFVKGHLITEAVLIRLAESTFKSEGIFDCGRLSFPQKVEFCQAMNLIDENFADFLKYINSIRNKIAHQFDFNISFELSLEIVQKAISAGVDFSDGNIAVEDTAREWYGRTGIIQEIFQNLIQDMVLNADPNMKKFHDIIC